METLLSFFTFLLGGIAGYLGSRNGIQLKSATLRNVLKNLLHKIWIVAAALFGSFAFLLTKGEFPISTFFFGVLLYLIFCMTTIISWRSARI